MGVHLPWESSARAPLHIPLNKAGEPGLRACFGLHLGFFGWPQEGVAVFLDPVSLVAFFRPFTSALKAYDALSLHCFEQVQP